MGTRELRSEKVGDSLYQNSDGIWIGKYHEYQLNCAYQPIVTHDGNGNFREFGFEGLVRPVNQQQDFCPLDFFKLIPKEDQLFIECMCQALHIRNFNIAIDQQQTLFININCNAYESTEVVDKEFKYLVGAFERNKINLDNFVFEIVETECNNSEVFHRLVDSVRDLGVKLAMDDFGKDASNFDRFSRIQPDIVKLDRSIFMSLSSNPISRQLLRSLVHRFHDMNATVLVEGLETTEDIEAALECDFNFFQGFAFSKAEMLPFNFQSNYPNMVDNCPQVSPAKNKIAG